MSCIQNIIMLQLSNMIDASIQVWKTFSKMTSAQKPSHCILISHSLPRVLYHCFQVVWFAIAIFTCTKRVCWLGQTALQKKTKATKHSTQNMTSKKHYTTKPNPSFQPARKQRPIQSGIHVSAMKNGSMILKFHIDDNSNEQKHVKPPKTNVKQEWTAPETLPSPKKQQPLVQTPSPVMKRTQQQQPQVMLPIVMNTPAVQDFHLPAAPMPMMLPSMMSLMSTIQHQQEHYDIMARNLLQQIKMSADMQNPNL